MSLKQYTIFFLPFLLASSAISHSESVVKTNGEAFVQNQSSATVEGEGKVESKIKTEVNGQSVEVQINQPGSVEVKNINGKVEIKTSEGMTPTVTTNVPTDVSAKNVEIEKTDKEEFSSSFHNRLNKRTQTIYLFIKGLFQKVFSSFLRKGLTTK